MLDSQTINELLGKCTIEANALQSLISNTKGDRKKCKQYLAHLTSIFSIIKALRQYENMEEYWERNLPGTFQELSSGNFLIFVET